MESIDLTGLTPGEVISIKKFLEFLKTCSAAAHAPERTIQYHCWLLAVGRQDGNRTEGGL